ncbi:DUF1317 family protein [Klebsiella michiganensis]|uniref:DUF1317 family protein n=1 Tax=Klebsiella michiganensis TaxID=1134687 RepID=UPI002E7BBC49|nr:DUF1317 family protein [Klebsiella michiganensis]MEE1964705.1 DUF1317 family protein [Klebsiella michiganensis]
MLNKERLDELLDYSPDSGLFTWKVNRRGWIAPSGDVIKNPLKAQRLAELMNSKKVMA